MLLSWSRSSPDSWKAKVPSQFSPITQHFDQDSCAHCEYSYKPLAPTDCLCAPYHALCLFALSATFTTASKSVRKHTQMYVPCKQEYLFFVRGVAALPVSVTMQSAVANIRSQQLLHASDDRIAISQLDTGGKS
jgi:hypothetical protein